MDCLLSFSSHLMFKKKTVFTRQESSFTWGGVKVTNLILFAENKSTNLYLKVLGSTDLCLFCTCSTRIDTARPLKSPSNSTS